MGKKKTKVRNKKYWGNQHKGRKFDPVYWINRLDKCLKKYGASFVDLPDFTPDHFKSERQRLYAESARARVLVLLIENIPRWDKEFAEHQFANIMEVANVFDDGLPWFDFEKRFCRTKTKSTKTSRPKGE